MAWALVDFASNHPKEFAGRVELLDAITTRIRNIDIPAAVDGNSPEQRGELPWFGASETFLATGAGGGSARPTSLQFGGAVSDPPAERLDKLAEGVELINAVASIVGDIDVTAARVSGNGSTVAHLPHVRAGFAAWRRLP